jgi:peptidoglycan/xylan/chitin deacetylase (PgdA/CDA1 family)
MPVGRTAYQHFAESAIERSGLLKLLEWIDRGVSTRLLPILLLHRIEDPAACGDVRSPDLISAPPAVFAAEMEYLARNFRPIGAAELVAALNGEPLPRRAVLLTFDDGTSDFREHAWPVLNRLGVHSMLCVPTAMIGKSGAIFWEDRLHQVVMRTKLERAGMDGFGVFALDSPLARASSAAALRTYLHRFAGAAPDAFVDRLETQLEVKAEPFGGLLSWDELRSFGSGVDVVPHSRRHVRLAGMAEDELEAEIEGSLADIRQHLGKCPPVFSYPYGRFDANVLGAVQRAGYAAGLSTRAGFAALGERERLTLRRAHIYHGTLAHFRLDLTRAFAWYTARREDLSARPRRRRR